MREKRLPVRMSLQWGLLQRSEGHIIRCICEGVDGPFTGIFGCLFLLLFWEVMNIYIYRYKNRKDWPTSKFAMYFANMFSS